MSPVVFILDFFCPIFVIRYLIANNDIVVVCQFQQGISSHMPYPNVKDTPISFFYHSSFTFDPPRS